MSKEQARSQVLRFGENAFLGVQDFVFIVC